MRRWLIVVVGVVVLAACIALAVGAVVAHAAFGVAQHGLRARTSLEQADFVRAAEEIGATRAELSTIKFYTTPLRWITGVPYLGRQAEAALNILDATERVVVSVEEVVGVAQAVATPLQSSGATSLGALSETDRSAVLVQLQQGVVAMHGVRNELTLAALLLNDTGDAVVWPQIREGQAVLSELISGATEVLDAVGPRAELLLTLGGVSREQTYLFLLQNNGEVRPTGGFIGTYGVVKLRNARITSFHTDNVYNLDDKVKDILKVTPPAPIAQYFKTDKWFFRDSNWSPDFTESARQALWFYGQEGGKERFDGVIALTPDVIAPLLGVVGSVTVEGEAYTAQNFAERLEYQVEKGYYRRGIPEAQRKEVIGVIASEVLDRLLALPTERWGEVVKVATRSLHEKHALVYFTDPISQQIADEQGWTGRVVPTETDFVMVADANMLAQKTDLAMTKQIEYSFRPSGSDLIAQVKLTYTNSGEFSWLTTRYRDWVRVYVPVGSTFIRSTGFISDEIKKAPLPAQVGTELGKTVFAGYFTVEPKETKVITLEYKLPPSVRQAIAKGEYHLYAQKQSGVPKQGFTANLTFPRTLSVVTPSEGTTATKMPNTTLQWRADLYTDRELTVGF